MDGSGIRSRADLRFFLRADLESHGLDGWRWRFRFTRRVVYFQWLLRRAEYWHNRPAGLCRTVCGGFLKFRVRMLGERLGFTIPYNCFGPGLAIVHYGSIVVNAKARIGVNCRIHSDVTIGQIDGRDPVLGNNVWIAPGARILGGITLGDGVRIGANAVVLNDIEAWSTAVGIPARSVRVREDRWTERDGYAAAAAALGYEPPGRSSIRG